jgi:hypothetical protein
MKTMVRLNRAVIAIVWIALAVGAGYVVRIEAMAGEYPTSSRSAWIGGVLAAMMSGFVLAGLYSFVKDCLWPWLKGDEEEDEEEEEKA